VRFCKKFYVKEGKGGVKGILYISYTQAVIYFYKHTYNIVPYQIPSLQQKAFRFVEYLSWQFLWPVAPGLAGTKIMWFYTYFYSLVMANTHR